MTTKKRDGRAFCSSVPFFGGSIFRVSELIYNEKNIFLIIVSPRILFNDDTSYLTVLPHLIKFKFHLRKSDDDKC